MPTCVAYQCNNASSGKGKVPGLSFFRFPLRDNPRCKEWVTRVGRAGFKPTAHSTLCQVHFEESMFLVDLQKLITGIPYRTRNTLIVDAVPTKFSKDSDGVWEVGSARRRPAGASTSTGSATDTGNTVGRQQSRPKSRKRRDHTVRRIERNENKMMLEQLLHNEQKQVSAKRKSSTPVATVTKTAASTDPEEPRSSEAPRICPQPMVTEPIVVPTFDPALIRAALAKDHTYTARLPTCTKDTTARPPTGAPITAANPPTTIINTDTEVTYTESNFVTTAPEAVVEVQVPYIPDDDDSSSDSPQVDGDSYVPSSTDDSEGVSSEEDETPERCFIVYEECLLSLMKRCQQCGTVIIEKKTRLTGSMVVYTLTCHEGHTTNWHSQPSVDRTPKGNLMLAAALLYTGLTWVRIAAFARAMNMPILERTRYNDVQREILFPIINEAWKNEKEKLISERKGIELVVSGDCRCDSPGHNAKYGNYTLMDGDDGAGKDKILEMQIVQCTEVPNSNHMEPEGMKRALNAMEANGLTVQTLVTDRHIMVKKILATEYQHIDHQFDLWHVAKSVIKKLNEKAKLKKHKDLLPWIQCVSNHLWWSCATCKGDPVQLRERWISILHHVTNKHRWTGSKKFKRCEHTRLPAEAARKKAWLKPDSESFKALQSVVMDKYLLDALPKLVKFCHTGSLEVFHNVLLKYCSKRQHFSYEGMTARTMLAGLDWNTLKKEPILDKDGCQKMERVYSKRRRKWILRKAFKRRSGNHIPLLMERTLAVKREKISLPLIKRPNLAANISRLDKPTLEEATNDHRTRFH